MAIMYILHIKSVKNKNPRILIMQFKIKQASPRRVARGGGFLENPGYAAEVTIWTFCTILKN